MMAEQPTVVSMGRKIASALVFPVVFGGALLATWWMLQSGVQAATTVFGVSLTVAALVTVLERVLTYEAAWSRPHADVPTDMAYAVSSLFAAPRLFDTFALAALIPFAAQLR